MICADVINRHRPVLQDMFRQPRHQNDRGGDEVVRARRAVPVRDDDGVNLAIARRRVGSVGPERCDRAIWTRRMPKSDKAPGGIATAGSGLPLAAGFCCNTGQC